MTSTERRKKAVRIIAIAGVIILLVALILVYFWHNGQQKQDALERSVAAQLGQLEGKSAAEIEAALNRVVEEGCMSISINTNPTFATGEAAGTLRIENVPANRYDQMVTITLDETGEIVYESGLLSPNYHIQEDNLLIDLDAGDYPCTAHFVAYDADLNEIGTAAANIMITILG